MRRKIVALVLLLAVALPLCGVAPEAQASETDLQGTIEEQIRAYADSIDQPNADDETARIIAMHGILMGGKTLNADEDHALTATLMNSELLQEFLTIGCTKMVHLMQRLSIDELNSYGGCKWYDPNYRYDLNAFQGKYYRIEDRIAIVAGGYYNGIKNEYDTTLEWVVGGMYMTVELRRGQVTKDSVIYDVSVAVDDRFDFSTASSDSVSADLLALFGSAMFREFDWKATASFQLSIPHSCTHSYQNYHWVYDPDSHTMTSDSSGEFAANNNQLLTFTYETNPTKYYYVLDHTVRLLHDHPWVLQYTIKGYDSVALAPTSSACRDFSYLFHNSGNGVYFANREVVVLTETQQNQLDLSSKYMGRLHRYGRMFYGVFKNYEDHTYTYRYENIVAKDGSNMVYVTVIDDTLNQTVVSSAPLNEYYILENSELIRHDKTVDWVGGKDFLINYIGNTDYALDDAEFELYIWENGIDGVSENYFSEEKVKATCTTPGGVRYTCDHCGYSYTEQTSPANGHDWGAYKANGDATCQKDGTKTAVCKTCGEKKTVTDEGTKRDHAWMPATCLYAKTCTTCGLTEGDVVDHDWVDATCTDPKTCSVCDLTEGESLGHKWSGATCQHANTCNVCGTVIGEPRDHIWSEATCTDAAKCAFCGLVDGEAPGHDFVGGSCTAGPVCSRCGEVGVSFGHQWTAADCNSARTCSVCGYADGEALGHSWMGPTCTGAKYCGVCGIVEGEPLGHIFADATCDLPKTCTGCGLTEGEPLGHDWTAADCRNPMSCGTCGLTEGARLDHEWVDATCLAAKTCAVCVATEGAALDHTDANGDRACDLCGTDLAVPEVSSEPTEPSEIPALPPTSAPTLPTGMEPMADEKDPERGPMWIIVGTAGAAVAALVMVAILRKRKK